MEFCSRYTGRVSRMDKLYRIKPHNRARRRPWFISQLPYRQLIRGERSVRYKNHVKDHQSQCQI